MQLLQATIHAVEELYLSHADIMNDQFPSEHKYLVLQQHRIQMDYVSLFQHFSCFLGIWSTVCLALIFMSFGAFVSLGVVRYSKTSFMIIYPMFLEKILRKEKYYFMKDSLSAGAAHKLGFPGPHAQGLSSIPVCSLGAAKTDGQEICDSTFSEL